MKSNIFVPPKEGSGATLQGVESFHKSYWNEGETDTKEPIFNFIPEEDSLTKVKNNDINFGIQNLTFDIIQLDVRRDNQFFKKY